MTEQLKANGISWPQFFQPRPGQEGVQIKEKEQIPNQLLDVFYLRQTVGGPTELAVVLSCLGGTLDIVTGERIQNLPDSIKNTLKDLRVASRDQFRAITADELYIGTLDAVLQETQMPGVNDPVHIFVTMFGKTEFSYGELKKSLTKTEGKIAIGRLDLLHVLGQSSSNPFIEPKADETKVYQVLLPAGPLEHIQNGKGLALLYPVLSLESRSDIENDFIVSRIMFEVLTQLQKDMVSEQIRNAFAQIQIPIYDRARLEEELEQDGFEINGNVAIKKSEPPQGQKSTWLAKIRSKLAILSASQIILPNEGTIADYRKLIDSVLPAVASVMDQKMFQVVSSRVEAKTGAVGKPKVKPAEPQPVVQSPKLVRVEPVRPTSEPVKPAKKIVQAPTPSQPRRENSRRKPDWSAEFVSNIPVSQPIDKSAWLESFESDVQKMSVSVVSRNDWEQDFQSRETRTKKKKTSSSSPKQTNNGSWPSEFESVVIKPKSADNTKDFE